MVAGKITKGSPPAGGRGRRGALEPGKGDALVVVDVQNDFVTGALAVPGAAEIIDPLNRAAARFRRSGLPICATRDWHPPRHCSFAAQGGPWPQHCIAGTPGADFAPGLELGSQAIVVDKATRADVDAYSAFAGTRLAGALRRRGVRRVFVGGLATDYCVLNTVRDALAEGFEVVVLSDAVRPVDVRAGDGARATTAMRRLGARFAPVGALGGASRRTRGTAVRRAGSAKIATSHPGKRGP